MFAGCSGLTSLNLTHFNTGELMTTSYMFEKCTGLETLNLSGWTNESLTNMCGMFSGCTKLKDINLSGFKTDKVEGSNDNIYMSNGMCLVFQGCSSLVNLNLSSFNTAKLFKTYKMFSGCGSLRRIIIGEGWNMDNVVASTDMFNGCTSLVGNDGTKVGETIDKTFAHASEGGYLTLAGAKIPGDANGDYVVDAADIVEIVNYLQNNPSTQFNETNADANGAGGVTAEDIDTIIGIILSE